MSVDAAPANRFAALLAPGRPLWMVNPVGASLDAVDMLAWAGARCVFIDCERTAVNVESVTALVRTAHAHGLAAVLRSESAAPEILVRYLDRGIDGLVVPHVETVTELQAIDALVRYARRGQRARFHAIAQIESAPAVANVEALAGCDAVDGFLIGPNDLSHSMGFEGDTSRPELKAAIDGVVATLQRHGRAWGIPATAETAPAWAQRGAAFLYITLAQVIQAGYAPLERAFDRQGDPS